MLTYRRATASDLDAICQMAQEVNRLHHRALPRIFPETLDPARLKSEWQGLLNAEDAAVFVAAEDDAVVGFVSVNIATEMHHFMQPLRYAWAGLICVAKHKRGRKQGVARTLAELMESWAIEHGAVEIRGKVWAFNAASTRLCKEIGFETRALEVCKTLLPK